MTETNGDADPMPGPDRRDALRRAALFGAAAVGAAAASVSESRTAEAATGDNLALGRTTNIANATTTSAYTGPASTHGFTFADNTGALPTSFGSATVVGYSTALDSGVAGIAIQRGGTGVTASADGVDGTGVRANASGAGGVGVSATGGSAAFAASMSPTDDNVGVSLTGARRGVATSDTTTFPLSLAPHATTIGPPTTTAMVGDISIDTNGTIWCCTAAGTPGTFVRLGGTASAGTFTAITPTRCFDSRRGTPATGALRGGQQRVVSVAHAIDLASGVSSGDDLVPSGATAVSFNLTIAATVGTGYLSVCPGSATAVTSSSINWTQTGQVAANGLVSKVDDQRQLRVFAGGSGATQFLIDINGYYR